MTVFEKEAEVARHQTGHNSGVVHAGIYYAPGSAKARMTRRGVGLLKAYCTDKGLAYSELGKLVVARDEGEVVKLRELERRSLVNQVPGLTLAGQRRDCASSSRTWPGSPHCCRPPRRSSTTRPSPGPSPRT